MPPEPRKKHEKEDYGSTGQTRGKPQVAPGTPMPDGERNPALHDIEGDPDHRKRRESVEHGA
ncbi:MAG: hypothetical protein QM698_11920 [Micropepsaceae bacterium]